MGAQMDAAFHHVAICVKDMEKVTNFYREMLGFEVLWDAPERGNPELSNVVGLPDAKMHITMLKGYGAHIEFFSYKNPQGAGPQTKCQCDCGLTHFALSVQGLDKLYQRLVKHGVEFNSPPQNIRPGVWVTYMRDCEGNTIELVQYAKE